MLRICPRTWPAVSDTTRLDPDPTQALLPSRDMVFSVKQDFLPSTVDGNFSGPQFLQIVGVYHTHTHGLPWPCVKSIHQLGSNCHSTVGSKV